MIENDGKRSGRTPRNVVIDELNRYRNQVDLAGAGFKIKRTEGDLTHTANQARVIILRGKMHAGDSAEQILRNKMSFDRNTLTSKGDEILTGEAAFLKDDAHTRVLYVRTTDTPGIVNSRFIELHDPETGEETRRINLNGAGPFDVVITDGSGVEVTLL